MIDLSVLDEDISFCPVAGKDYAFMVGYKNKRHECNVSIVQIDSPKNSLFSSPYRGDG